MSLFHRKRPGWKFWKWAEWQTELEEKRSLVARQMRRWHNKSLKRMQELQQLYMNTPARPTFYTATPRHGFVAPFQAMCLKGAPR